VLSKWLTRTSQSNCSRKSSPIGSTCGGAPCVGRIGNAPLGSDLFDAESAESFGCLEDLPVGQSVSCAASAEGVRATIHRWSGLATRGEDPRDFTTNMSPAARSGKVNMDYLRQGSTMRHCSCTRAFQTFRPAERLRFRALAAEYSRRDTLHAWTWGERLANEGQS
jgi:hypothetical protein